MGKESSLMRLALTKKRPQNHPYPFCHMPHWKARHLWSRKQALTRDQTYPCPDLGLLSLQNYQKQTSVIWKPPSLWYFFKQQPKWNKIVLCCEYMNNIKEEKCKIHNNKHLNRSDIFYNFQIQTSIIFLFISTYRGENVSKC